MSIESDIALLERCPTFQILGREALRVFAISSEQLDFSRGDVLFRAGEDADCGFVVSRGAFRVSFVDGSSHEVVAGVGSLIGELALIVPMQRPATAVSLEFSSVIRVHRQLFLRVLDSDPAAARRLRDEIAGRTSQAASDIVFVGAKLG